MENEYTFENITDIIELVTKYKTFKKKRKSGVKVEYNNDFERLIDCIEPLQKLNKLVGMDEIKKNIVDQILFYSQRLNTDEMMHTCLTGPPGVGKTTLGKILSELYCSLGFLETDNFKIVSKPDLIAGYLGQTAIKTQKVLKSALGGVLMIDEAYSLGSGGAGEDSDAYGKECIDTINKFLSENTSNFIMIIAGYKEELDNCFFSLNKGLKRRFPWCYDIGKYSNMDLKKIFIHQVHENKWFFDENLTLNNYELLNTIFEKKELFDQNGGDTLILFDKTKICHSRRVFGKRKKYKKILNLHDIKLGMELFKSFKSKKQTQEPPFGFYT